MQLHELRPTRKASTIKRVGRGGKRGTYSGRGTKGQKARAGHRIRPGFKGGNEPLWKLFPKSRGASRKTETTHRKFRVHQEKDSVVNLYTLSKKFTSGDSVTPQSLLQKNIISDSTRRVKILSKGDISLPLTFKDVVVSVAARAKIIAAKGQIL